VNDKSARKEQKAKKAEPSQGRREKNTALMQRTQNTPSHGRETRIRQGGNVQRLRQVIWLYDGMVVQELGLEKDAAAR
jgi:hypothetical protein